MVALNSFFSHLCSINCKLLAIKLNILHFNKASSPECPMKIRDLEVKANLPSCLLMHPNLAV